MKIKTLMARAARCTSEADAQALLSELEKAFCSTKALGHLGTFNSEAYMEGEHPHVRFELNHKISDSYITMVRPEIRSGEFSLLIETNHMLDGLGMQSQSWAAVADLDAALPRDQDEVENGLTIAQLAGQAKDIAINFHAELIERVGVPRTLAKATAKKCW